MSYLLAAYSVVWILLFAYITNIASKQRRLDRDLETIKKLLERKKAP